jgi:hypothetical protein
MSASREAWRDPAQPNLIAESGFRDEVAKSDASLYRAAVPSVMPSLMANHIDLHDNYDYEQFKNRMICFEYTVRHTDWQDAAIRVWNQRDQWQTLTGFDQNHWKAAYLLGWNKAEYTEKTV